MAKFEITAPDGKRYEVTAPDGASQDEVLAYAQQQFGATQPVAKDNTTSRSWGDIAGDTAVTALKGAVGLPEAFVGLADIPTGGRVGKALDEVGVKFGETQKTLDTFYSAPQQEANRKVQQAKGFVDTTLTALENPSTIITSIGESIPQMLGGAGLARLGIKGAAALGGKVAPWLAGALGEGAIGAGSAAEGMRQESPDQLLTGKQSVAAIGSGIGTAAFGAAGGKLAQKFKFGDMDTILAQGGPDALAAGAAKKGFLRQVTEGGISEGVFEELPQSIQETMWQNWATDKPLFEGTGHAGAMGMLAGLGMGIGGGGYNAAMQPPPASNAPNPAPVNGVAPGTNQSTPGASPSSIPPAAAGASPLAAPPSLNQAAPGASVFPDVNESIQADELVQPDAANQADRMAELDAEYANLQARKQELNDPANGYGPMFDTDRAEIFTRQMEIAQERAELELGRTAPQPDQPVDVAPPAAPLDTAAASMDEVRRQNEQRIQRMIDLAASRGDFEPVKTSPTGTPIVGNRPVSSIPSGRIAQVLDATTNPNERIALEQEMARRGMEVPVLVEPAPPVQESAALPEDNELPAKPAMERGDVSLSGATDNNFDVSGRTDAQLANLVKAGKPGWREAAIAESARRKTASLPAESAAPKFLDALSSLGNYDAQSKTLTKDGVTIQFATPNQGKVAIFDFNSGDKGRGNGARVLKEITSLADATGVDLELSATPIDEMGYAVTEPASVQRLVDFYRRNGFVSRPGTSTFMDRKPNTGAPLATQPSQPAQKESQAQGAEGKTVEVGQQANTKPDEVSAFDQRYPNIAAAEQAIKAKKLKQVAVFKDGDQYRIGAKAASQAAPSNNLIQRIKQLGGIHTSYRADVIGDKAGAPGLFSNTGKGLDDLATALQAEGFAIDTAEAGGGVDALTGLIQRAVNSGETVLNYAGQQAAAEKKLADDYRDQLKEEIAKLGGTPARNASTQKLVEILNMLREKLRAEVEQESIAKAAQLEVIIGHDLTPAEWDMLLDERNAQAFDYTQDIAAIARMEQEREAANAVEREQEGEGAQTAVQRTGEGPRQGDSTRGDESQAARTEQETFGLTGQTPEEIKAKEDDRAAKAKAEQESADKAEEEAKKKRIAAEVASRQQASAENFQLGQSAEDALAGQGDIFSRPSTTVPAQKVPDSAKPATSTETHAGQPAANTHTPAKATRSKPKTRIAFDGITGPTGAKLTGYEWAWKPYAYVDRLGEDREGRESDWDNAETNVETGRDIVHKFTVEQAGNEQTVSLETALQLLGFAEAGSLSVKGVANTAKRVAKIKMAISELEPVADAYDKAKAEVDAMPYPPITVEGIWARMGDAMVRRRSDDSFYVAGEKKTLELSWKEKRMAERGFKGSQSPHDVIADLNAKLERAERKMAEAVKAAANTPVPAQKAPDSAESDYKDRIHTLDVHEDLFKRVTAGTVTADEFKASFEALLKNKDAIVTALSAMTKDAIFKRFPGLAYRYKNEKKADAVKAAYRSMLDDFVLGNSISWSMGEKYEDVIRGYVDRTSDQDLADHAAALDKARAERAANREQAVAGMADPQTLDDFNRLMIAKAQEMGDGTTYQQVRMTLTPEQRARFDELAGEKTRAERKAMADQQKTTVSAPGEAVGASEIIKTKHTKHGHDLWQFTLERRVAPDEFKTLVAQAKRMGGDYSSYRGNGAIPGWQFRSEDAAIAFRKLVAGDTTAAREVMQARRDAFQDDKSQSAVERLSEMAERLEDQAAEALGRDRKANTARRARFAASAEAAANSDKALAKTMRNIAQSIADGKAKFLDRVRQKAQVEMLRGFIRSAKDDELRQKYPAYIDYEKHQGEKPTGETADHAKFPSYTAFRSDLASLGRQLEQIDGTKKLGASLLKVADDVTSAYLKFAKENLNRVSTFSRAEGKPAIFASKEQAEEAIKRSGFKGKAVVLPFKRGQNIIIMSPSAAKENGIWPGDDDKRITLTADFGAELVEKVKALGRANRVSLPCIFESAYDARKRLSGIGIETPAEFRAALREFIALQEQPSAPDKIKEMERAMIGRRKDGLDFFPTPQSVAQDMIEAAELEEGMAVLEPSAGMGHIAEQIRDAGVEPDVVEISNDRRELLEAKGFNVVGRDFLDVTGEYDRVVMNPPFSDRRDIEHVRHAYELLRPGGRLVAIMGEGSFFGSDKKATEFRDWLESLNGTSEKLEDGAFLDPTLPVNTGVAARMVVIDKPTEAPRLSRAVPWYSPLNRAIQSAKRDTMPGEQWRLWLQGNKASLGVKDDELQFSGVLDYLALRGKEKVTKGEIADYLSGNGVVVQDVVKGATAYTARRMTRAIWETIKHEPFASFYQEGDYLIKMNGVPVGVMSGEDASSAISAFTKDNPVADGSNTKFADYWESSYKGGIPGTYREILVTLPRSGFGVTFDYDKAEDGLWELFNAKTGKTVRTYQREGDAEFAAEQANRAEREKTQFKSSHWDEPNVLVHIRLDEVNGADGKRYVRVGEVQSDFGQEGKRRGFKSEVKAPTDAEVRDYFDLKPGADPSDYRQEMVDRQSAGKVPDAPFVTDTKAWVALGIKRAIMHAVDVGADGIVFGTGEQNANLYDLSKQVDRLDIEPYGIEAGVNQYRVTAMKDGARAIDRTVAEHDLENVVGKDIAKEVISGKTRFEGEGLRVGGEGMRAFYDKIVPQVANDVLKKIGGGKVGMVDTRPSDPNELGRWMQPGFLLPESLRAKLTEDGLPLFARQPGTQGKSIALRDLNAMVDRVRKSMPNLPTVHVLTSPMALDLNNPSQARLREFIEQAGALEDVEGAAHEGEIYLFASGLADEARAEHVLAVHEITHYGLRAVFGMDLDPVLQSIWATNANIRKHATALREKLGLASNVEAVEEILADMEPAELVKLTGWRRLAQVVRDWFRGHGFTALADQIDSLLKAGLDGQRQADLLVADVVNAARGWVKGGKRAGKVASGTVLADARKLADDLPAQEKWLNAEARMRGFKDIEDLLARDYPLFEKLATLWRKKHPADVMMSRAAEIIEVDGKARPTKNSNGKPIAQTDEALTNFWRWFGDSAVADEQGRPLVVYHGTASENPITEFNRGKDGIWFAEDSRVSDIFGDVDAYYLASGNHFDLTDEASKPIVDAIERELFDEGELVNEDGKPESLFELVKWGNLTFNGRDAQSRVIAAARRRGYTGIKWSDFHQDALDIVHVIFDPTQIKSSTGNSGTFDPANPDIRLSRAGQSQLPGVQQSPPVQPPSQQSANLQGGAAGNQSVFNTPEPSKMDDIIFKLQDSKIDLKRAIQGITDAGRQIADKWNTYMQEELFHGRTAKRVQDFADRELAPMLREMALRKVSIADLDKYLWARHAKEANALIEQRDPGVMVDDATGQPKGSGMTDQEADDYFAGLSQDQRNQLDAIARKVDGMIARTRDLYVSYGLENRDTVQGWADMFQHYVPLMREDHDGGMGIGQGFSIKGREAKHRTGSTRAVADVLANIATQRERAIVRGEKNRVAVSLAGLVKLNPAPDFWTLDKIPQERVLNEKTGLVETREVPNYRTRDNVIIAKIKDSNGNVQERAIVLDENDERAVRLAKSMKNIDIPMLEGWLGSAAAVTRYFSAINTQYNPVFGVVNLIRDTGTGALNLSSTALKGKERAVTNPRRIASAVAGIYSDARKERKGQVGTSPWAALWEEFTEEGGQTGYRDMFRTSNERANAMQQVMDPTSWTESKWGQFFTANGALKVPLVTIQKAATPLFNWLSDFNLAMENAVRLSAYKEAVDSGMSKQQAASLAKNLTVNFNRKGAWGAQAGALYAFFNAATQGTARIGETLTRRDHVTGKYSISGVGKKIIGGGVMLGVMQAVALAMAGYDDDEPPEFIRERNIVVPLMDGKYISIPMPLGFHVIPNIGRIATETLMGRRGSAIEGVIDLMGITFEAFNPMGSAGWSTQTVLPTVFDPMAAIIENKDWTGKPIAKEKFSNTDPEPGFAMAKDNASSVSTAIAYAINLATGGSEYAAGKISPTPDQIDYLWGQVTGGVGREGNKLYQSVESLFTGEELPPHKIPLAGRLYGNTKSSSAMNSRFYDNIRDMKRHKAEYMGRMEDGDTEGAQQYLADNPEAEMIRAVGAYESKVQQLRSAKRKAIEQGDSERAKEIEMMTGELMERFNQQIGSAKQ